MRLTVQWDHDILSPTCTVKERQPLRRTLTKIYWRPSYSETFQRPRIDDRIQLNNNKPSNWSELLLSISGFVTKPVRLTNLWRAKVYMAHGWGAGNSKSTVLVFALEAAPGKTEQSYQLWWVENGLHRLIGLNTWSSVGRWNYLRRIRRCVLVIGGVLLESGLWVFKSP